jgi:hypothetical protein
VPLTAKSPRQAFSIFQDHLNGVLNKVLTQSRLQLALIHGDKAFLAFFKNIRAAEGVAVPLPGSRWHLYLGQVLQAVGDKKHYQLRTAKYAYRIQRTPDIQDEAAVRFEYVSRADTPDFHYCRHHVQFHRDSISGDKDFSLCDFHIPTGWVTVENVIRFLIADLRVRPLTKNWGEELRKSEAQFREWTAREVPE